MLYILDENNWIYEDKPDDRDGSVPGCSSDLSSAPSEQFASETSSIESSASSEFIKKR